MKKNLQIGVIGSAGADHSETATLIAQKIGMEIARRGHTLMFGPELNPPSLSTIAAQAAIEHGGVTIAIALGRGKTIFENMPAATHWVFTDQSGGGGREVILTNSCDGIVAIGGGVGTLIEIGLAYLNVTPIVLLDGTGGWTDRLSEPYLDSREKVRLYRCNNVNEAIDHIEIEAARRTFRKLENR